MIRHGYLGPIREQLHYAEAGDGDPIVLIHSNPNAATMWTALLPELADRGFRAIAIDTPGYGSSDPLADSSGYGSTDPLVDPLTMAGYARRIVTALADLPAFHLLGQHTGGTIAATIAADYPDRVRRAAIFGYPNFPPATAAAYEHFPEVRYSTAELQRFWDWRRSASRGWTIDIGVRSIIERIQAGPDPHAARRALVATDHTALAKRVHQPVLLICGSGDDLFDLEENTRRSVPFFPDARYVDLPGATMDVADEQPAALAHLLAGFFRQHV